MDSLSKGSVRSGDLIPWTISQQVNILRFFFFFFLFLQRYLLFACPFAFGYQFQDNEFPSLSGARVVRIATHPEYQKMGYGTFFLFCLISLKKKI